MATRPNGHDNPEGQKFCGDCGDPMAPAIAEPDAPGPAEEPTAEPESETLETEAPTPLASDDAATAVQEPAAPTGASPKPRSTD